MGLVHRNLGWAYSHVEHDNAKAIASLESAVACNRQDPRVFAELDTLYDSVNADLTKRLSLLERNHEVVARRDDALLREISLLILLGRYDRALELMENNHFRAWEGENGAHDVYANALLLRGQRSLDLGKYAAGRRDFEAALEYPERFETAKGRRGQGKLAEVEYFLGLINEAEGRTEQSRHCFEQFDGWSGGFARHALLPRVGCSEARPGYQGRAALRRFDSRRTGSVAPGG